MAERKLDEKRLKKIQMDAGHRGPGGQFAGFREKPKNTKEIVSKLLAYISWQRTLLAVVILLVIIETVVGLSTNIFTEKIVNSLGVVKSEDGVVTWISAPNKQLFITLVILMISVYIIYSAISYFSAYFSGKLAVSVTKKLRDDLFAKIVKFPIVYTDTHPHGDIMSRMTNDIDNISMALSQALTSIISGIITIIGCLFIMLWYSPLLTAVSLITLALSVLITFGMNKFARPLFTKQQSILGLLNSQTEETVSGCKTVIAYNHQEIAKEEFNEYSNKLCKVAIKAQIFGGAMGPIMNFTGNFGHFLVCFFGALFIINNIGHTLIGNPIDIGIVVLFINISKQFTRPINQIASLYGSLITALAGAERVFAMLDEPIEDLKEKKVDFDPIKTNGYIEFNNVDFSYVPGKKVIDNFTVDVRSGHKIALVGATGSGKTTIVNLLLRYYDIDSGSITIDGINIADMSKKDLRDCISIVLQDSVLFEDTVENNIKYGKANATEEEFNKALEMANCKKFVNRLPNKEKTVLTEGATNISQGQRQLLTIARAVLADPKILILDEATSSVDTRTEKKIQDAMVKLMANRTSIIIAHRLSTIQDADLIIVMDHGKIVEMGNHEELIEKDGVYNKLYQTQYQGLSI